MEASKRRKLSLKVKKPVPATVSSLSLSIHVEENVLPKPYCKHVNNSSNDISEISPVNLPERKERSCDKVRGTDDLRHEKDRTKSRKMDEYVAISIDLTHITNKTLCIDKLELTSEHCVLFH